MNLKQWCELDECIYIGETDEQYKQHAGLDYSEKLIEQLAEIKLTNSKIFIDFFSEPRALLLGAIEDISYSKNKKLELELHNKRNTKIVSSEHKFKDSFVNWSTWRQFNSLEKNQTHRKKVFDEFIAKTRYISPIVESRFSSIKVVYQEYQNVKNVSDTDKITPLSGYLENEKVPYTHLVELIKSMGDRAKKPFRDAVTGIGKKILGREPEYYDDFYFFRNKVYSNLDSTFSSIDPIIEVRKILTFMQFDLTKIVFDIESRANKYPSPICFFVQIPNDIRILYKKESPYFGLQGCFHEFGHGMHASSIDQNNEYWDKYRIPMGVEEILSIFFERLTKNANYIRSLLPSNKGNIDDIINEVTSRNRLMELFFVTFYTANSLMKLEYWNKNLSVDEACDVYSKLIKEYVGFEIPGEYWLLHHILPEAIMYVPSYLLASIRAAELDMYMQNRFGDKWWTEEDSGKNLNEIMKPGAKIDLSIFSRLDSSTFMKEIT